MWGEFVERSTVWKSGVTTADARLRGMSVRPNRRGHARECGARSGIAEATGGLLPSRVDCWAIAVGLGQNQRVSLEFPQGRVLPAAWQQSRAEAL